MYQIIEEETKEELKESMYLNEKPKKAAEIAKKKAVSTRLVQNKNHTSMEQHVQPETIRTNSITFSYLHTLDENEA